MPNFYNVLISIIIDMQGVIGDGYKLKPYTLFIIQFYIGLLIYIFVFQMGVLIVDILKFLYTYSISQ